MGLWNFVKSAGAKLVGRAEASDAPAEEALQEEVSKLGLDT